MGYVILAYTALAIGVLVGYIMNIVDLVHATMSPLTTVVVLRIVGLFIPPLGAIMGYAF